MTMKALSRYFFLALVFSSFAWIASAQDPTEFAVQNGCVIQQITDNSVGDDNPRVSGDYRLLGSKRKW